MRPLIWIISVIALLYGGYWLAASRTFLAGVTAGLDHMRETGTAQYANISIAGFPSRFDLTITAPQLTNNDASLSWSAPFLQVFALSYHPNQLIAVWPQEQSLVVLGTRYLVASDDFRASVRVGPSSSIPLDHAELATDRLSIAGAPGWSLGVRRAVLASRQSGGPTHYQVALVLSDLALGEALHLRVDPDQSLPNHLDEIRADAVLDLDRPLDRHATEQPPRIQGIRNISLAATWGGMRLTARGEVSMGVDRSVTGHIDIAATNWRAMLTVLTDSGVITSDRADQLARGLSAASSTDDGGASATVSLHFADGLTWLGPFPVGPAPRL